MGWEAERAGGAGWDLRRALEKGRFQARPRPPPHLPCLQSPVPGSHEATLGRSNPLARHPPGTQRPSRDALGWQVPSPGPDRGPAQ